MTEAVSTPRPLRVLFAIGSLAAGGSERQLLNILKHIDRTRIEPHLYLLDRLGEFLQDVPHDVRVTAFSDVAQASGWYFPGRVRRQQIEHLAKTLREHRIDVLYDRTFLMPLITGPASAQANVPRISTIVADPRADLRNNVHRFRWLKQRLLARAYREASCVVAVSQELAQLSAELYGLDDNRIRTIYNGFDFETIDRLASEPCPELDRACFNIVSIGRLQEQKAVDQLLLALKQLEAKLLPKPLRVWVIGEGPDAARLSRMTRELGLTSTVSFVGYQANPYRWLRNAQLFVLTSRSEGMPNVLVEAMACGTPVISTNCQFGPSEILNEAQLGTLIPVDDPDALAAAIEKSCGENKPRRTQAARESIEARFSTQACVSQLTEVILHAALI